MGNKSSLDSNKEDIKGNVILRCREENLSNFDEMFEIKLRKRITRSKNIFDFKEQINKIDNNEQTNINEQNYPSINATSLVTPKPKLINFKSVLSPQEIEKNEIQKFKLQLLEEFNKIRTKPKEYAKKIESFIQYIFIKPDSEYKNVFYYFEYKDKDENNQNNSQKVNYPKIRLIKGEPAFKNCISVLTQTESMKPLELSEELVLQVPNNVSEMNDKNTIFSLINAKNNEINKIKHKNFGFHYDIGSINAEVTSILQIVDDNYSSGRRRENILNKYYKYLGISVGKIKFNRYAIYLFFAGE